MTIELLDLLLSIFGRLILATMSGLALLVLFWGCAIVIVEAIRDIQRRLDQ